MSPRRSRRHNRSVMARLAGGEFAAAGVRRFLLKPTNVPDMAEMLGLCVSSEASDTRLSKSESDTTCLRFAQGECVRIAVGSMEGLKGTVVAERTGGKILLQLQEGVYVEIHQYCVEEGLT